MDQTFHIYLNSEASKQTFHLNDSCTFTQLLPERLTLEPQGKWYCRVTSCNAGFRLSKPHYLLCDLCNESIVRQRKKPILCLLHHKVSEIIEPAWVPVKSRELSQIKIQLQRVDNPTTLTVLLTVYWNLNNMKLYAIAPNANLVAKHFEQMAKGQLPRSRDQHTGYGFLGSRFRLGSYTQMKGGAESKQPQTVRGITPTEVGIQQAKSELQAQTISIKKRLKKKGSKKGITAGSAKGQGQSEEVRGLLLLTTRRRRRRRRRRRLPRKKN